jgi:hypothetical protein
MFSMSRCVLRWGLIGAAGLGTLAFLVGPDRIAAGVDQIRNKAHALADDFVEDPVALRRQLAQLAEKYPERIAEVRTEIFEIDRQVKLLEKDRDVARRVVAMTNSDLSDLRVAMSDAEVDARSGRTVSIRVDGRAVDFEGARNEARRIATIRSTYQDRHAGDDTQLAFFNTQKGRLVEILDTLEDEHARYEAKLWQLDRQIDAIDRNDRLIEMTKQQQQVLSDYDKFAEVGSLDQLEAKLAELRTVQEAQLQSLSSHGSRSDYEKRAKESMSDDAWEDFSWDDFDLEPTDGSATESFDASEALSQASR